MSEMEPQATEATHVSKINLGFEWEDYPELERLAWSDRQQQPILEKDDLPPPLRRLFVSVDGSSETDGAFSFSTQAELEQGSGGAVAQALSAMNMRGLRGRYSLEKLPDQYVFQTVTNQRFFVGMDEQRQALTVRSLKSNAPQQGDIHTGPAHGIEDFHRSFTGFLDFNANVLAGLYESLDVRYGQMFLRCAPLISMETVATESETVAVRLSDMAGYGRVKQEIYDLADEVRNAAELREWGIEHRQGLLLYGPPGTGKTRLVEAFAGELGAKLRKVTSDEVYDMYVGNSEKQITKIFDEAVTTRTRLVLLFDELDAIINSRSDNAVHQNVAGIFKQRAGRLTEENPHVILAATTNWASRIDEALVRSGRFDVKLEVVLPDAQARGAIFALYASRFGEKSHHQLFDELDFPQLAAASDGMSGADIETTIKGVVTARALHYIRTNEVKPPATTPEIIQAICVRRGIEPESLTDKPHVGQYL